MYDGEVENNKDNLIKIYKALQMARGFENACNQQYMQGKIRGFMHLDNGQEAIPGLTISFNPSYLQINAKNVQT